MSEQKNYNYTLTGQKPIDSVPIYFFIQFSKYGGLKDVRVTSIMDRDIYSGAPFPALAVNMILGVN